MKNTITSKQLTYAAALFIIASNLLTKSLYTYTENQSWLSVVIAAAAGLVIISMYGRLVGSHPGKSLIEINEAVFGAAGGKLLSVPYVFFFLTLTAFNTRDLGYFVKSIGLPDTPMNLIYVPFIFICAYAAKKGADKMTRYSVLILFVYIPLLLFITGLLIRLMRPENLLPVFTVPVKNFLLSAHLVAMLPFAEIFAFLMLAQSFGKPEAAGKALRRGLIIGAVITLFLVVRDIAVLGNYTLYASSPTFNTIRLIDIGDILTRLEIINAVLQIIMLFFKTSVLLNATVAGIGKLFNIRSHEIFTLIISALAVIGANVFFASAAEHSVWFRTAATYASFFHFVLPLATLIVSWLKKNSGKRETG